MAEYPDPAKLVGVTEQLSPVVGLVVKARLTIPLKP